MEFTLTKGTMDVRGDAQSWIITSDTAEWDGMTEFDEPLRKGDIIKIDGGVWRNGECVGDVC